MDDEVSPSAVEAPPASGVRIVDIRQPSAFTAGHIPGSENVPFDELPDRVADLADADRIVTVCPHGKASVQAARLIASYEETDGTVVSLAGGLEAWDGALTRDESDESASRDVSAEPGENAPF